MPYGRCDNCGGAAHPYAVYSWSGKPLVRDAVCPKHRTPLAKTTTPKDLSRIRPVASWQCKPSARERAARAAKESAT
jgi:hypothetical protein